MSTGMKLVVALFGVLIAVNVAAGDNTVCYFCTNCATVRNDQVLTCIEPNGICYKTTTNGVVNRGCFSSDYGNGCQTSGQTTTCICSTDRCNGSGHVFASPILALLISCLVGYQI